MGEGRKKRKDKEYEKLRTIIICIFIWQTQLIQTYNALLDVESVARDTWSPPPVHGMGTASMDLWIYPQVLKYEVIHWFLWWLWDYVSWVYTFLGLAPVHVVWHRLISNNKSPGGRTSGHGHFSAYHERFGHEETDAECVCGQNGHSFTPSAAQRQESTGCKKRQKQ